MVQLKTRLLAQWFENSFKVIPNLRLAGSYHQTETERQTAQLTHKHTELFYLALVPVVRNQCFIREISMELCQTSVAGLYLIKKLLLIKEIPPFC